ncbi:uncharacterized protein B0P05DRAFT_462022, partial [Gilbertella persicaria]|uniref:uncharacterized protein n=1 Tax=Gilbertella persicaria TaxID=101096 RepID=UPI0022206928
VILNCKMDRGFFISQSHWTCYRRNYFQVTASFIVPGHTDQSCYALQLYPDKPMQPIQRFFLRLRACTSITPTPPSSTDEISSLENSSVVKPIALTQMTPKRDKGPQREPPVLPITPSDSAFSSEQVCVTFERLQFRVATANNGKRRASQQYFCLIFQLVAQLEDATQHVVSECYSSPLVVRGRSPGHYSTEPQTKDVRKKKKLVSPQQEMLPSPTTSVSQLTKPSPPPMDASPQFMATQFHGRSQSANDSDFFARNRLKYQRHDEGGLFDDYHVGIQSALRNWQQQVARQRTDSGTTFDDASSSAYLSSEKQTKSSTPVSYHSGYSQPSMANHWSPRQTHYVEEASPKLYHHHHHQ